MKYNRQTVDCTFPSVSLPLMKCLIYTDGTEILVFKLQSSKLTQCYAGIFVIAKIIIIFLENLQISFIRRFL
ncbi:hypothetical protein HZS_6533 [Henneguya salminicola]|nr:hypothetical protein HZS_6533 [Henneguya salminicola]